MEGARSQKVVVIALIVVIGVTGVGVLVVLLPPESPQTITPTPTRPTPTTTTSTTTTTTTTTTTLPPSLSPSFVVEFATIQGKACAVSQDRSSVSCPISLREGESAVLSVVINNKGGTGPINARVTTNSESVSIRPDANNPNSAKTGETITLNFTVTATIFGDYEITVSVKSS